jgi:opacity protein-like surface antigen
MKRIALMAAAACAAAATPAAASNWKYVAVDDDANGRWAYDAEAYTAKGSFAHFLARHEQNNGEWQVMTIEVDCSDTTFRVGYVYKYNGRTFLGKDMSVGNWKYIANNTIGYWYAKAVCE